MSDTIAIKSRPETAERNSMSTIKYIFDEYGCPKRFECDGQYMEDWNGLQIGKRFFTWKPPENVYFTDKDPFERPENMPITNDVKEVVIETDKKSHLVAVYVDGYKVFQRDDSESHQCRTTFYIYSVDFGRKKIIRLEHDFQKNELLTLPVLS